jgi:hypothetical protein
VGHGGHAQEHTKMGKLTNHETLEKTKSLKYDYANQLQMQKIASSVGMAENKNTVRFLSGTRNKRDRKCSIH